MKNKLIDYYALLIIILNIIYNIILSNLIIGGFIYQIFMIILIIININILIKYNQNIKHKNIIIIIYIFIWLLFSKNALQCFFGLSNIITLIIINIKESKFIKVLSIILSLSAILFYIPIILIYLFKFGYSMDEGKNNNYIYDDMHYVCKNNYEVYAYSLGAMDSFHYIIGKKYNYINLDDIIYIYYNKREEVSYNKYNNYIDTHECILVGDKNGS